MDRRVRVPPAPRRPNASSTASTSSPGPPTRSTRSGPLRMARDQEVRHGPQRRQGPDQGRPVGAAEERVGPERRPTRPARVHREHQRDPLDRVQAQGTPRDDPQAGARMRPRPCCASGPRTHPCAASRNSQNSERRSHGATSTSDKARNLAHFVIRASWKRTWPVPCTIFSR
ncbi:hypothetical protein BBRE_1215 [Bifidobacterium breve]|nr:hypothetical protein BBRE_1215 [Bifidobacterium breve]